MHAAAMYMRDEGDGYAQGSKPALGSRTPQFAKPQKTFFPGKEEQ